MASCLLAGEEEELPTGKRSQRKAPSSNTGLLESISRGSASSRGKGRKAQIGDVVRCRRCLEPNNGKVEWCKVVVEGEEDKCAKCETLHNTVLPLAYNDFCDKYHKGGKFKEDVDKADKVYCGEEDREGPAEALDEETSTEFSLTRSVLALTGAEMKEQNVPEPEQAGYPKIQLPNAKGANTTWYLAEDRNNPFHKLSVTRTMGHCSKKRIVDDDAVFFGGQTTAMLNHASNKKCRTSWA